MSTSYDNNNNDNPSFGHDEESKAGLSSLEEGGPTIASNGEDPSSIEMIKVTRGNTNTIIERSRSNTDVVRKNSDSRVLSHAVEYTDADDFKYNHTGLTSEEAKKLLEKHGLNVLPEKVVPKWYIFVQQLWQPMPIMIWIAIIIEAGIQNFIDMGILLFIQFANATIGFYEITKAGDAVAALKASLKPVATVKRDGVWQNINATLVVPGDMCLLGSGSAVPADSRINGGEIDVDQAALTGESLPITMLKGDSAKMGSTVVRGEVDATVEFTGIDTFFGKTAALLQGDTEVSNMQRLLIKIVLYIVVLSITMCGILLIYLSIEVSFEKALHFVVVLLVASIPMAIEIVSTTTLALGSKELSKHGAIVARLAAIEDMAGMSILCSDKTGTLTLNQMIIQENTPIYEPGETQYSLLRYAAMAAKWKEPPRDALDRLTLGAVDLPSLDAIEQLEYVPFDPVVKRTEGTVKDHSTGKTFKTTKGAPHILLKLVMQGAGGDNAMAAQVETDVDALGKRGIRSIAVARTDEKDNWRMLGLLTFLDPPRPDTKETIDRAREYGVAVKMITGDHLLIAKETSRVLGLGTHVRPATGLPLLDPETKEKPKDLSAKFGDICLAADGFAEVFPEHKFLIVECLRELEYKVGMTGDGVNDAPALKRADVGVAVAGATDAARAAADIVLTQEGLSTIIEGIILSRMIWVRIRNFLTYRVAATLQLVFFFFIAVFLFKPIDYMPDNWQDMHTDGEFPDGHEWPEFFQIPVLLLMLITVLNDGTLITIGYDNAVPTIDPPKWNLPFIFAIASIQAFVAMFSSLILLQLLLDSWSDNSFFKLVGVGGIPYGKVISAIYLKVSISDFMTLFSSRAGGEWFWSVKPAKILFGGAIVALTTSTIIAMTFPDSTPDHVPTTGLNHDNETPALFFWVWLWSLAWWFVGDAAKVALRYYIDKNNWFKVNETGVMQLTDGAMAIQKKMAAAAVDDDQRSHAHQSKSDAHDNTADSYVVVEKAKADKA